MKTRIVETSAPIADDNAPLVGASLMRSVPALITLAATLFIAGCQQLPANHWSGTTCPSKTSEAKNCYPTALPHMPVHK